MKQDDARPMRTVTKTLSYIKAAEARALLTSGNFLLSRRGTVVVDERNNMLIIRDNADRLSNILALLDQVDTPVQQVIIEARIVETTRPSSATSASPGGSPAAVTHATATRRAGRFPTATPWMVGSSSSRARRCWP